jgi:hypothetical protein
MPSQLLNWQHKWWVMSGVKTCFMASFSQFFLDFLHLLTAICPVIWKDKCAASMYSTLKLEKWWATMREFAQKIPVFIAFTIVVGTSTWQPWRNNSILITIVTPRAFDCFRSFRYDYAGPDGGKVSSTVAESFKTMSWTLSRSLSQPLLFSFLFSSFELHKVNVAL